MKGCVRRGGLHLEHASSRPRFNQKHSSDLGNRNPGALRAFNGYRTTWQAVAGSDLSGRPTTKEPGRSLSAVVMKVPNATGTLTRDRIARRPMRPILSPSPAHMAGRRRSQLPASVPPSGMLLKIPGDDNLQSLSLSIVLTMSMQSAVSRACVIPAETGDGRPSNQHSGRQPIHQHYANDEGAAGTITPALPQLQPESQKRWGSKICRMGPVVRTSKTGVPRFACHTRSGRR